MSTALLSLWEQRDGSRLTLAAYHAMGGVRTGGAAGRDGLWAADGDTADGCPADPAAAGGDRRHRRTGSTASADRRGGTDGDTDARVVLDTLAARRLLTVSKRTPRSRTKLCCASGHGCGRGWTRMRRAESCVGTSPQLPTTGRRVAARPASCTEGHGLPRPGLATRPPQRSSRGRTRLPAHQPEAPRRKRYSANGRSGDCEPSQSA